MINDLFIDFKEIEVQNERNPFGRGLGLSICRELVQKMGGHLSVDSEVGVGTTFKILLKF
jgi:signal transduction histidine kinase